MGASLPSTVGAQPGPLRPWIEVIEHSAVTGPDEVFSMRFAVGGLDPSNLSIEVTLHQPVTSIEDLDEDPGPVISRFEARPGGDFLVESGGVITMRVPTLTTSSAEAVATPDPVDGARLDQSTESDSVHGLIIDEAGVYPLVVNVGRAPEPDSDDEDAQPPEASLATTLIRHDGVEQQSDLLPTQTPSPVIVLLDIGSGHEPDPGSGSAAGALSIEEATEILAEHPGLTVNVLLRRPSVERLQADPELAASFAQAVDGRPVVAEPLRALDPSALAAIGQWRLYRRSSQRTATELVELGLSPEPTVNVVSAPITDSATVALIAEGFTTVLDTTPMVEPQPETDPETEVDTTAPEPEEPDRIVPARTTTGAGELLLVPVGNDATTDHPRDGNRWLAELVLSDLSDRADGTPDTDDPEAEPVPDKVTMISLGGGFDPVAAARPVLQGLEATYWFEPLSLNDGLAGLTLEARPVADRPAQDLSSLTEALGTADRLLATYQSFYVDGPNSPSDFLLALSDATTVELDPAARLDAVEAVSARLDAAMQGVSLPGNQSVTLAARSAAIPLTIDNASDGTRRVELRFRTDQLIITEERLVIDVPPGSSVVEIDVEARSLGTSPLAITVLTPDGQRSLASTRFRVRSTAVPGLGLLLSVGGLSMLGVWWYLSIRRSRTADPDLEPAPAGPRLTRVSARDPIDADDSVEA
jgi:hypothetical protein